MNYTKININDIYKNDFSIYKNIQADKQIIFKAWTDPVHVRQWWGPYHFTNPVCQMNVRIGGRFRIEMTAPDGAVFPMHGIFHEIVFASKLVFTIIAFKDERNKNQLEYLNKVTFTHDEYSTLLKMKVEIMKSAPGIECLMDGIKEGWHQSFDKLESYIINNKHQIQL